MTDMKSTWLVVHPTSMLMALEMVEAGEPAPEHHHLIIQRCLPRSRVEAGPSSDSAEHFPRPSPGVRPTTNLPQRPVGARSARRGH